jgi:hypothetical protein
MPSVLRTCHWTTRSASVLGFTDVSNGPIFWVKQYKEPACRHCNTLQHLNPPAQWHSFTPRNTRIFFITLLCIHDTLTWLWVSRSASTFRACSCGGTVDGWNRILRPLRYVVDPEGATWNVSEGFKWRLNAENLKWSAVKRSEGKWC